MVWCVSTLGEGTMMTRLHKSLAIYYGLEIALPSGYAKMTTQEKRYQDFMERITFWQNEQAFCSYMSLYWFDIWRGKGSHRNTREMRYRCRRCICEYQHRHSIAYEAIAYWQARFEKFLAVESLKT